MTYENIFIRNRSIKEPSGYLISDVSLDEFDDNKVKLFLRPYEIDVEIAIVHYGLDFEIDDMKGLEYFTLVCDYDRNNDLIEIEVNNGFDEFIFNICSLLGIGRITIDENVESVGLFGYYPICDRVKSITLSLEEFNMLDGFVGEFSICNPSFDFLNMIISVKDISERVGNGSEIPEVNSEYLRRGEKLFLWD